jgi:hypothetical protein
MTETQQRNQARIIREFLDNPNREHSRLARVHVYESVERATMLWHAGVLLHETDVVEIQQFPKWVMQNSLTLTIERPWEGISPIRDVIRLERSLRWHDAEHVMYTYYEDE